MKHLSWIPLLLLHLAPLGAAADTFEDRRVRLGVKEGANGGGNKSDMYSTSERRVSTCQGFLMDAPFGLDGRRYVLEHLCPGGDWALILMDRQTKVRSLRVSSRDDRDIESEARAALRMSYYDAIAARMFRKSVIRLIDQALDDLDAGTQDPEAIRATLVKDWLELLVCQPGRQEVDVAPGWSVAVTHACASRYDRGTYQLELGRAGESQPVLAFGADETEAAGLFHPAARYFEEKAVRFDEGQRVFKDVIRKIEQGKPEKARGEWIKRAWRYRDRR
jgi:hypothetical protein